MWNDIHFIMCIIIFSFCFHNGNVNRGAIWPLGRSTSHKSHRDKEEKRGKSNRKYDTAIVFRFLWHIVSLIISLFPTFGWYTTTRSLPAAPHKSQASVCFGFYFFVDGIGRTDCKLQPSSHSAAVCTPSTRKSFKLKSKRLVA